MNDFQKHLKKNFKLLQKNDPSLAYQLAMVDPTDLEFCWTQQGEINLKRFYDNQEYYYHSPLSALQEAQDWFQTLDLHLATVIFVYGVGLGYYYEVAKTWLKQHPHHALVFLEEDPSVLYRLCETPLGSALLRDPQVHLFFLKNSDIQKLLFNELSWTYFGSPFIISSLKLYQQINPTGFSDLHHQISYHFEEKKAAVDEYLQFGVIFFRNFYPNLFEIPHSSWGNGLFQRFSQVPAIICGAGPSLNKNIDLLPQLKDRALLFAGGSALNALIPKEVIPHFGVAVDPNIFQYSRVVVTQPYQIPFFYRNRLFHEALLAITGPRLYLTGAGGYATAEWFEQQLNIEGEHLDEGHNVVNFSLQIAHALGCNPIILVGVDLAFTDKQYYADGIAKNLNLTSHDLKIEDIPGTPIVLQQDIEGKPITTLWKWVKEAEWIAQFAENHPETTILNATEGGLGFKGIENVSLQEAAQQFLKQPQVDRQAIQDLIHQHSLSHVSVERIFELLEEMKESLNQCAILTSRAIEESDRLAEQIQQNDVIPDDLQTPAFALLESDLEEEIGYEFLLTIFHQVYTRLHHRSFQDLDSPKRRFSPKKQALKKLELHKQRLVFLRDVARFNRELIQRTIEEKRQAL